jgi:Gpi18-like mannosyltransferase
MIFRYIKDFTERNRSVLLIVLFGLGLRLIFTYLIAPHYFNRENINLDGDTTSWMAGLYQMVYHGEFTMMAGREMAYYCRMPGYSFFLAPAFFMVSLYLKLFVGEAAAHQPEMWYVVLKITAVFQMIIDSLSIYLIYYIVLKMLQNYTAAIIAALLYATYPFIIAWNPVCYAEVPSVFFCLSAIALSLKSEKKLWLAIAGFCLGFAVLNRPQFALLAPLMLIPFYQKYGYAVKQNLIKVTTFFMFFVVTYGAWPLRNYLRFDKIILTQDLRGYDCWNDDVIAFMQYIYSVKAEWNPQFTQIIQNKTVVFPKESYRTVEDSLMLEKAVYMAKNCGRGFSEWEGYWKETILIFDITSDCSAEVAAIFNQLRKNQIKHNPFNFYVKLPLKNLKKAIFKSGLQAKATFARTLGENLFYYRSLLILLGLIGCWKMIKTRESRYLGLFTGLFFAMLYGYLCFGTSPQCRNIEMRYFLQADVLMLIPAAFLLSRMALVQNFTRRFFPASS